MNHFIFGLILTPRPSPSFSSTSVSIKMALSSVPAADTSVCIEVPPRQIWRPARDPLPIGRAIAPTDVPTYNFKHLLSSTLFTTSEMEIGGVDHSSCSRLVIATF